MGRSGESNGERKAEGNKNGRDRRRKKVWRKKGEGGVYLLSSVVCDNHFRHDRFRLTNQMLKIHTNTHSHAHTHTRIHITRPSTYLQEVGHVLDDADFVLHGELEEAKDQKLLAGGEGVSVQGQNGSLQKRLHLK